MLCYAMLCYAMLCYAMTLPVVGFAKLCVADCFSNGAYLPFGGGVSYCPGRRFARNEVKALLAFLVTRFDLTMDPDVANPGFDNTRAGVGIFPPRVDVPISVALL